MVNNVSMNVKISASILSADFGKLNEEIKSVEKYVDEIHIDVMDGHFVPNLTFGQVVLKDLKTSLRKNCHLMVDNPEILLKSFADAGADHITVHHEVFDTQDDLLRILAEIHTLGMTAGVSIKPKTDISEIEDILGKVEEVLVMSVEPGFGGQSFMENSLPKIKRIRELAPELDIAVDGGINEETAKLVTAAGANILIAGSYIFHADDRVAAIQSLKS